MLGGHALAAAELQLPHRSEGLHLGIRQLHDPMASCTAPMWSIKAPSPVSQARRAPLTAITCKLFLRPQLPQPLLQRAQTTTKVCNKAVALPGLSSNTSQHVEDTLSCLLAPPLCRRSTMKHASAMCGLLACLMLSGAQQQSAHTSDARSCQTFPPASSPTAAAAL